jgi:hypothetical protein
MIYNICCVIVHLLEEVVLWMQWVTMKLHLHFVLARVFCSAFYKYIMIANLTMNIIRKINFSFTKFYFIT